MKKKREKTIFLTDKALVLIFCMVFLIDFVVRLISEAHLES